MDILSVFFSTFALVFVGELGDKTQIAAGTGSIANQENAWVIFLSSSLALVAVVGITVIFAGFIPAEYLPQIQVAGGVLLILYGGYLFLTANSTPDGDATRLAAENRWMLFTVQFGVVFVAEFADKTQFATLAAAIENPKALTAVGLGAAAALISVTGLTVLLAKSIPTNWIKVVQQVGAILLVLYGAYMIFF